MPSSVGRAGNADLPLGRTLKGAVRERGLTLEDVRVAPAYPHHSSTQWRVTAGHKIDTGELHDAVQANERNVAVSKPEEE